MRDPASPNPLPLFAAHVSAMLEATAMNLTVTRTIQGAVDAGGLTDAEALAGVDEDLVKNLRLLTAGMTLAAEELRGLAAALRARRARAFN